MYHNCTNSSAEPVSYSSDNHFISRYDKSRSKTKQKTILPFDEVVKCRIETVPVLMWFFVFGSAKRSKFIRRSDGANVHVAEARNSNCCFAWLLFPFARRCLSLSLMKNTCDDTLDADEHNMAINKKWIKMLRSQCTHANIQRGGRELFTNSCWPNSSQIN